MLYHVPQNLEMKDNQAEENGFCCEATLGSALGPVGNCAALVSPLRNGTLPITTGVSIVGEGDSQQLQSKAWVTHRLLNEILGLFYF